MDGGCGAHDLGEGRGELLERRGVVEGAGAQRAAAAARSVLGSRLAAQRVGARPEVGKLRGRMQRARADAHARPALRRRRNGPRVIVAGARRAVHLVLEA